MNYVKTAILLAAMTALFGAIGFALGGTQGMLIALLVAAGMNVYSYWNSDKIVLRAYRAVEVNDIHPDPTIRTFAADTIALARAAAMPIPKIYVIDNDQPNAFATGRNPENAAVAATTGLLRMLDRREVRGVMAHELAHVTNRDTLIMTVTATIAGAIGMLANFAMFFGGDRERPNMIVTLAVMLLAPMMAAVVQMAISRGREYEADRMGAEISGDPAALASALEKIERGARRVVNYDAEENKATAHMFIINPLAGRMGDNLFSTHPATANRIAALRAMAGDGFDAPAPSAGPWGEAGSSRGPWG